MSYDEISYFRERASEERERAASAASAVTAEIHLSLAIRYEALIAQSLNSPSLSSQAYDGSEEVSRSASN
jgi:hypothetical protein